MKININKIEVKKLKYQDTLNNSNPSLLGLKQIFFKQFKEFLYFKNMLVSSLKINVDSNRLNTYFSLFFMKKKTLKLKKKVDRIKLLVSKYKKKFTTFQNDFLFINKKLKLSLFKRKKNKKKLIKNFFFGRLHLSLRNQKPLILKSLILKRLKFKYLYQYKKDLKLLFLKKSSRRQKRLKKQNKKFKQKSFIFKVFKEFRKKFQISFINFKLNILNKFISKLFFKRLKKKLRNFKNRLFNRRLNFFIDFIRLATLYKSSKINLNLFLNVLSDVFRRLTKKTHTNFLKFVKELFKQLILCSNKKATKKDLFYKINNFSTQVPVQLKSKPFNSIQGIKFLLNGKVKGKLRARSHTVLLGATPVSTINKTIEFSQTESYTVYGTFGLKLWVYRI